MTRGQNSLVIDAGETSAAQMALEAVDFSALALPVIEASEAEAAAHAAMLLDLDKASGGKTVWRPVGRAGCGIICGCLEPHQHKIRAVSSGVEHNIHTVGVGGSKPPPPTKTAQHAHQERRPKGRRFRWFAHVQRRFAGYAARMESSRCGGDRRRRGRPGGRARAGAARARDRGARARRPDRQHHQFAQQRGHPRRHLLRHRLAEGTLVRAGARGALRLLRNARCRTPALRQAAGRDDRSAAREARADPGARGAQRGVGPSAAECR